MLDRSPELRHTGVVKIRTSPDDAAVDAVGAAVPDGHTRRAIVRLLVESGSITAGEIGDRLGLSAAGVRRHLDVLIDAGDAESTAAAAWQQMGRGRPAKRYRLTAAGRAKLDHAYDDLASAAMRQLREIGGEEAVQRFARQRIDSVLAGVAAADSADDADVEAAAERIAAAMSKAGFVATTTRVGGPIHGVQICQHHCPVSHVAEEFPELCDAEQQAMAEVLGTHVQRLATIVNGDCACTTHVPLTQTATTAPSPRRAGDDAKRSDAEDRRYMTDNTSTKGASL
ncbi:metalloregulator ArsR/SmtB family transcription factor [Mycobacterium sp.]|uniref:helix-turn-helix transcriptional regulator n=1 Tax=Mycobacterium sp. TaxID=1785 RepID=UPI0025DA4F87|nr:metalloregulator ArsR/SmtB family transcription factor [Mycobacterium sp.]